ncbi:IS5 family transposase [Bradyrhizobium japonicum]|nr:IS5 family transposase [Bradyrhizobium japonicum]MCP1940735.1 IS5 family transposase [Bradyrhizobium japonicum]
MRPKKHKTTGSNDLFRARLDQIINMKHELVLLAGKVDWDWIDGEIAPLYSENGRPGIETRFMIGLLLLKHIYGLSDEEVCERWVHDPYFQFFTGEEFFQHTFPHERSDLSHWRKRLGDKLELLLAESLRVAHEAGALRSQDLKRVTVDTTVQPKAITFPTDAKLLHAAIKGLNRLAIRHGVRLRQSYARIAKAAAMMAGRYAHAKQFRRHQRQLRILRSRLGRIIRDIRRKIEGQPALEQAFALPLGRATQIRSQQQRQRGWKLYSFHAPEVECIGKGKASAPYEFGVKASIVTNNRRAPGGLFVLHASALPDNPYDGHTLRDVIDRTETLTGCPIERAYVDKGYRGHDAQNPRRVFISGQKRGVFGVIKRELRRRSAIEPIIGHLKAEGHLGRCYLKGRAGDAANVVLSAVGHNFRRILAWLRYLLTCSWPSYGARSPGQPRSIRLLNGRRNSGSPSRPAPWPSATASSGPMRHRVRRQAGPPKGLSNKPEAHASMNPRAVEHDPEKCEAVLRKDHAQTKESAPP